MLDLLTSAFLIQDGLTSGVVYALIALSMVLLFTVTRVLFIAHGELIAFAALGMSSMEQGRVPPTVYLMLGMALACTVLDGAQVLRHAKAQQRSTGVARRLGRVLLADLAGPLVLTALFVALTPAHPGRLVSALLVTASVTWMGPQIYRLAFQRIADASSLVLLFVSVAVHYVLLGVGLSSFGPEGWRTQPFVSTQFELGPLIVQGQAIVIWAVAVLLLIGLRVFFRNAYLGRVLIATACNRKGAKLVGVRPETTSQLAFAFGAAMAAVAGILIAPTITFAYDSGFLILLKGMVAAVIGAMVSYPLAALGALAVGVTESFAAFYTSTFKEAIVFLLLVPFVLWMSIRAGRHHTVEED